MKPKLLILLSAFCIGIAHADNLTVNINGLDSQSGFILIGVFGSHEALESSKYEGGDKRAVAYKVVEVTSRISSTSVTFTDLPPGVYAVGVIRDENANGRLDTKGPFRKPVEPFGMSGNPRPSLRFPKWEDVAFRVIGNTTIGIQLMRV